MCTGELSGTPIQILAGGERGSRITPSSRDKLWRCGQFGSFSKLFLFYLTIPKHCTFLYSSKIR